MKTIDPISNMRNSNLLPKAVKDYYNLIVLKSRMVKKSTSNKFLLSHGKMVVGNEKIVRVAKEIKAKKSKSRKRSK
jgi:hypothetical protein